LDFVRLVRSRGALKNRSVKWSKRSERPFCTSLAFCCPLGKNRPDASGRYNGPISVHHPKFIIHLSSFTLHKSQLSVVSCQFRAVAHPRAPSSAMAIESGLTPFTTFLSRRRRRGLPYYSQEGHHDRGNEPIG
jgi:hypothetical protein